MAETLIIEVVAEGERLRTELLAALAAAPPAEEPAVTTELILFYGQAFTFVLDALAERRLRDGPGTLWHAKLHHECLCGRTVFRVWQRHDTPLDAPPGFARMDQHWRAVTALVQAES